MTHYIEKLIREGEHQQQDFKFCITDSRKIAKTLSAFANTDGGRLLIGVKDNGKIAGVQSDEEYYMIQAAAQLYSRPKVQFQSKVWQFEGKDILEIIIPHSSQMPHFAQDESGKWLAYIRCEDQNHLANRILLKVWQRKAKPNGTYLEYSDAEQILLHYLESKPFITLNHFSRIAKISRYKAERILVKLICWEVIQLDISEEGTLYRLQEK